MPCKDEHGSARADLQGPHLTSAADAGWQWDAPVVPALLQLHFDVQVKVLEDGGGPGSVCGGGTPLRAALQIVLLGDGQRVLKHIVHDDEAHLHRADNMLANWFVNRPNAILRSC